MQPQGGESVGDERGHRRGHVAAAGVGCADPVAKATGLGDAAAQVGEGEPADQHLIAAAEQEIRVGLVVALILGIAPQASAERAAREIVGRPGRLPWGEKRAARLAQRRPFCIVAGLRRAQENAGAFDERRLVGKVDGAKQRHGQISAIARVSLSDLRCFPKNFSARDSQRW